MIENTVVTVYVSADQKSEIEHNLNNKLCIIRADAELISGDSASNALDRLRAAAIVKAADYAARFIRDTFVVKPDSDSHLGSEGSE